MKEYSLATIESEREPGDAVIGVIVQQAATIDLPVEIDIDAGAIGGPSAGLAFALDIVDELGSDVDQGRRIVATGELALDGQRRADRRHQAEGDRREAGGRGHLRRPDR